MKFNRFEKSVNLFFDLGHHDVIDLFNQRFCIVDFCKLLRKILAFNIQLFNLLIAFYCTLCKCFLLIKLLLLILKIGSNTLHLFDIALNSAICLQLRKLFVQDSAVEVLGPAPAPVLKLNNRFRYRCVLVGKNDKTTREKISWLLKDFANDRANRGLNIFADCNTLE